jgi:hypothetical protein
MSGKTEVTLSRVLPELRSALRSVGPSSELDARFRRSVDAWSARRSAAVAYRRALPSLIAAGTVAAVVGLGWWLAREGERGVAAAAAAHGPSRRSLSASYEVPDAAVLHVQATLGAWAPGQGQYWVDIGVTGDGTLRVERVTPVDERFVP